MSSDENSIDSPVVRKRQNALQLGPRKKPCRTDPLVHYGRHFGRSVHALCNVSILLNNGLLRINQAEDQTDVILTDEEEREHTVFRHLLQMIPGLEDRLADSSEEEIKHIADLIQKGTSGARSDDAKGLKGAVLDWVTPRGQPLNPPLARNVKTDRGFHHERTGALLCPTGLDWSDPGTKAMLRSSEIVVSGDQWPVFLYQGYTYNPEDPWNGLLRSALLVSVRFALSSSSVFSRTDTATESERFYVTLMDLFGDLEEKEEVDALQLWWNRQIFSNYLPLLRCKATALARIKEKRLELRAITGNTISPDGHVSM